MAGLIRGFQINTVPNRLAQNMLGILQQCLVVAPLDRNQLHLTLLMTLSRRVDVEDLLYLGYRVDQDSRRYHCSLPDGRDVRIHE